MKATYQDHMGSDLTVVNAARVSFAKRSAALSEGDKRLIRFLARGMESRDFEALIGELAQAEDVEVVRALLPRLKADPHWTPFAHATVQIHMCAPMTLRTQCFKHKVGFVESEVSRRYVDTLPELYTPVLRKRAADKKQGSLDEFPDQLDKCDALVEMSYNAAIWAYRELIRRGVCPEHARFVLPGGTYTEWIWTGSLAAWARFARQRSNPYAQLEIQQLAKQVSDIIAPLYPVSWDALMEFTHVHA